MKVAESIGNRRGGFSVVGLFTGYDCTGNMKARHDIRILSPCKEKPACFIGRNHKATMSETAVREPQFQSIDPDQCYLRHSTPHFRARMIVTGTVFGMEGA